jgi:alkanesulfonate monooxygenase SsuD/methylene tetrahydromethanopterin reductase-like flavin-dependent oxidoreductase (luciferase family)
MLGRHERLKIGTDVLVAPYRNPLLLAAMAGSVARLSGGRLVLGMGIGYLRGEFAALQIRVEDRAAITDEVLDALRVLWQNDGPHHYEGQHIRFDDILPTTDPEDAVPIWVGGNNSRARARAAQRGDGWHPLYPTFSDYARGREDIDARRAELGLTAPFTYSYSAALCRVMRTARVDWQNPVGGDAELRPEYRYAPDFPRTAEGRPVLCGTAEQVAGDVDSYRRAGVEHLVLRVWTSGPETELSSVMDQLRRWAEVFGL